MGGGSKDAGKKAAKATTPATPGIPPEERAKKATTLMTGTESAVNVAITNAKKVIENAEKAPETQVKATADSLTRNKTKLEETLKSITEDIVELRKAGPSATSHIAELQKFIPKIKTLLGTVNQENIKITGMAKKLEIE